MISIIDYKCNWGLDYWIDRVGMKHSKATETRVDQAVEATAHSKERD